MQCTVAPESTTDLNLFFVDPDRRGEESLLTFMLDGTGVCESCTKGLGIINGTSPVNMQDAIITVRKSGCLMSLVMGTQLIRMRSRDSIDARPDQIHEIQRRGRSSAGAPSKGKGPCHEFHPH